MDGDEPRGRGDEEEPDERRLTIDDVPRLGSGTGIAIGCLLLVVAAIALFWVVRGWWMRG
jgi:hypothetical protein